MFFNTGPYGGGGSCVGGSERKKIWGARKVEVVFDTKMSASQRDAFTATFSQFNTLMGGQFDFAETTRDLHFSPCPVGAPINEQLCNRQIGQILVPVVDDVLAACEGASSLACTGGVREISEGSGELGTGYIVLGTAPRDSGIGAHELTHLLLGGCHPNLTSVMRSVSAFGAGWAQGRWTDYDLEALTEAASKGVLRPNATRDDYIRAGVILRTASSAPRARP